MSNPVDNTTSTAYTYTNTKEKPAVDKEAAEKSAAKAAEKEEREAVKTAFQQARLEGMYNNAASLFNNTFSDKNTSGFDFMFSAGADMTSLKTINSARLGIESRARNLMSEIKMDQMRGVDTSSKREQLAALTDNLNVMNKTLDKNIGNAIKDPKPVEKKPAIIDSINDGLKKVQEKEEAKVQEKYGKREDDTPENPAPEAAKD